MQKALPWDDVIMKGHNMYSKIIRYIVIFILCPTHVPVTRQMLVILAFYMYHHHYRDSRTEYQHDVGSYNAALGSHYELSGQGVYISCLSAINRIL